MYKRPLILSVFVLIVVLLCFVVFVLLLNRLFGTGGSGSLLSWGDVAVLEISGPILDSKDALKQIERFKKSHAIKAVVVRIDSPGGAVAPSQEIYEELRKLKKEKIIVSSIGSVGASGGYYIACASHLILANPGSITGSIGVIIDSFGVQDLVKQLKIENRVLKTGEFKDVGNPFREMTEQDKNYLQQILEDMYLQFKETVVVERKISLEVVEQLAQGKVYTGRQALANHLIDRVGTVNDAVDEAKKLAGLPEDAVVIWPKEEGAYFDSLLDSMSRTIFKNLGIGGFSSNSPLYLWK